MARSSCLLALIAGCSNKFVESKDAASDPDASQSSNEEKDTSDMADMSPPPSDEIGDSPAGPNPWDAWVPDDDCGGGWPGTSRDGDAVLSGDFAPAAAVLAADASDYALAVDTTSGFSVDDEIFLHGADGTYAFARVVLVAATELVVADTVSFLAGTVVQRVPHFSNVTVSGEVLGSRIVFRAGGTVTVDGTISASGGGHRGGRRATGIPELGWQGASEAGPGTQSNAANGTGGGGGSASCNVHADGGGGGHATAGATGGDLVGLYGCAGPAGVGGGTIGDASLATMHFGGGAGGGYLDDDASIQSYGGAGGAGGGLVYAVASGGFMGTGTITADGENGEDGYYLGSASPGGGGGGAGGTIRLMGTVAVALQAVGGGGGVGSEAGGGPTLGGAGGQGRIRVDGLVTGTSIPAATLACP